jgi:cell division septation protein DedD
MRFEIRAGGALLILVALIGLSGAVFALGLVAGYEMARQNQPDLSQTSTTYPLPSAPTDESKPPPVAEMSPPAGAPTSAPAAPGVAAISSAPKPSRAIVPGMKPPAVASSSKPIAPNPAPEEEKADSGPAPSPAVAAPASTRRPYNIQIEAVMDKSAADEMVSRLKALGYNAQELTTTLNGQTMYRVRVGPYASADEAAAAEGRLHEQYRQAYTTSH